MLLKVLHLQHLKTLFVTDSHKSKMQFNNFSLLIVEWVNTRATYLLPRLKPKSSNQGGGSIANTSDLKGRVSVVVIDVLPNGVLVIEGARMVTFSGESYYAVLKGMVRQEDIGFGFKDGLRYRNIISSQYIADAQIEFVSKGSLNDAQKESWYQRLASESLTRFNF